MITNDAASASSAAESPTSEISRPASAEPPTAANAKPMLSSALPSRSRCTGWRMLAIAPRVSARAVTAMAPSTSASKRTGIRANSVVEIRASAAKTSASIT